MPRKNLSVQEALDIFEELPAASNNSDTDGEDNGNQALAYLKGLVKVVIHPDRVPHGEHERRFNAPTANEIAAVVVSSERTASRDIVFQAHDGRLTKVPDTHRFYDALEYWIIFWKGQEGYSFDIPLINKVTKQLIPNKKNVMQRLL
ncbi:helitron_like_N domain-containing protein [Trichonephila clavipes]|nr:helitron_like_N domain-containing protein [Trichonephila clavipes]